MGTFQYGGLTLAYDDIGAPGEGRPMLLVHGLHDPLVPVSQAKAMTAALTAADVPNQTVVIKSGAWSEGARTDQTPARDRSDQFSTNHVQGCL